MPSNLAIVGEIKISKRVQKVIGEETIKKALSRFERGDWGKVSLLKWAENEEALKENKVLHGLYKDKKGNLFTIITNEQRTLTHIRFKKNNNEVKKNDHTKSGRSIAIKC